MPIYNYKCLKCGRKFEEIVGVNNTAEKLKCPGCGSGEVKKMFSTFSVGKSSKQAPPACCGPQCSSGCPSLQD